MFSWSRRVMSQLWGVQRRSYQWIGRDHQLTPMITTDEKWHQSSMERNSMLPVCIGLVFFNCYGRPLASFVKG